MSDATPQNVVPDNEIRGGRLLNAPRELVWTAFSDPNHLVHWWGPKGFTNSFQQFDFRVGGLWKFIMHGPNGKDFPNESRFVEIEVPSRIVLDHVCEPYFRAIITLEDRGTKTQLVWRQIFETADICRRVAVYAVPANEENFDRLEERLRLMSDNEDEFVISRQFDAPRDLVWKAWTDRDELKKWFGPKGYTMPACRMDFRVGGIFHYTLKSPEGVILHGRWVFREIVPPEKLVAISSFSDEKEGIARHPMSDKWPLEIHSTTTLVAQGEKTLLTVRWHPINAAAEECRLFVQSRASMQQGWGGTFQRLEEYLAHNQGK